MTKPQKHQTRLREILAERGISEADFRNRFAARIGRNPNSIRALVSNWMVGNCRLNWEHERIVKKILDLPADPLYHSPESITGGEQ